MCVYVIYIYIYIYIYKLVKRQNIEKNDFKTKNCFSKHIVSFVVLYGTLWGDLSKNTE